MGDRLTDEENPQQTERPVWHIFDELFPHYLLMGMTPEQYWDGESSNYPAYRKAYQLRMENQQKMDDIRDWYMGQYFIKALQAVPLFVAGLNTKGVELPAYPEKPFLQQQEEQKREEVRKKREEDQMNLAMAMFQSFVAQANKRIEGKQKPGSAG